MMKEAALFVISAGTLVYFLAPVSEDEKPKPEPVKQEQSAPVTTQVSEDDAWGYEDEGGDEDFAFGQSLLDSNTGNDSVDGAEDKPADRPAQTSQLSAEQYQRAVASASRIRRPVVTRSPEPGETGSRENPQSLAPPVDRR